MQFVLWVVFILVFGVIFCLCFFLCFTVVGTREIQVIIVCVTRDYCVFFFGYGQEKDMIDGIDAGRSQRAKKILIAPCRFSLLSIIVKAATTPSWRWGAVHFEARLLLWRTSRGCSTGLVVAVRVHDTQVTIYTKSVKQKKGGEDQLKRETRPTLIIFSATSTDVSIWEPLG